MALGPLPDDFVLEYTMLHLMDEETTASTPPAPLSHVDDLLLTTCSIGASRTSSSCASLACAAGGACCSEIKVAHTKVGDPQTPNEVAAFSLDGEQFLQQMEQVGTLDWPDATQTNQMTFEHSDGGAIEDLETLTDLEMESSPCPSTCPGSMGGQVNAIAADEFEVFFYQPMEMQEIEKKKEEEETDERGGLRGCGLPPASPLALDTTEDSVPAGKSETNSTSFGEDAGGVPDTLIDQMLEEEEEMDDEEVMEDEIDLLGKEVKYLDAQMDFLQSRAKSSRARRKSVKQRRSSGATPPSALLAKSQEDNQLLTELVAQQQVYRDNFKAMLAFAPVVDVRMALMTPIESYIRLGKDFDERRKTILSLREEKLDITCKFIEQKAAGIDVDQPYQYSDMFEKFGKHYFVDFAISKYDGVSVSQVGRAIYEHIAGKDEALNNAMGSTTIRESFDTIKCNFMHQRIVSSMKWEGEDGEKMPDMESNAIFYSRFGDNSAVLAIDYIDQDELHPYDTSNCIRRDISSGVVLSGHTDADGKKFVVMKRYLLAKYHMYPRKVSQKQQARYFASMPRCGDTMETLIADRLQRDETYNPCTDED
uniref:Uncharacterized protein n=1 Tax=Peronospora matthiolae TaxID=2874970 RepID=A0AAV1UTU6_9STRA